jgi:hypothetical protein
MGELGPPSITSKLWGNWRGSTVSKNVLLFPDEKVFSFTYSNEYKAAWGEMTSKGLLGKVTSIAEAARGLASAAGAQNINTGGKFVSKYLYAPSWTGTKPISIGALKFTFRFGQAGLFSGEHEVVRPIIALAKLFSPTLNGNYAQGPAPTAPAYLAQLFVQGANVLKDIVGGGVTEENAKDSAGDGGLINKITELEETLMKAQDAAIIATLKGLPNSGGSGSQALCIRMGRMILGPFAVKNVSWSFDFTQTDEYGFPYQGSLTFDSLENILMPTSSQIENGL